MGKRKNTNPQARRPTAKEKPYIMERRELVLQCRGKLKLSVRETQEILIQKGFEKGSSLGQIQADYDYMLALAVADEKSNAENFLVEEIDVQNDIHRTFYSAMKKLVSIEVPVRDDFEFISHYYNAMETYMETFAKAAQAAAIISNASKERSKLRGNYKQRIELEASEALARLLGEDPARIPKEGELEPGAEEFLN